MSARRKQKLNTRSSTEDLLVETDDAACCMYWISRFYLSKDMMSRLYSIKMNITRVS